MDIALTINRTTDHFDAVEKHFHRGVKAVRKYGISFAAGLAMPVVGGLAGAGAAFIIRDVPKVLWDQMAWAGIWGACVAIALMMLVRASEPKVEAESDRSKAIFLAGRQVFLGDRGVIEAGDGWQTLTYWAALSSVISLTDGYLMQRGEENGIFIPYSAFTDDGAKGHFLIYVNQRMGRKKPLNVKSLPPPPPDGGPIHLTAN